MALDSWVDGWLGGSVDSASPAWLGWAVWCFAAGLLCLQAYLHAVASRRSLREQLRGFAFFPGPPEGQDIASHVQRHFQGKRLASVWSFMRSMRHFNALVLAWALVNELQLNLRDELDHFGLTYISRHVVIYLFFGVLSGTFMPARLWRAMQQLRGSLASSRGCLGCSATWRKYASTKATLDVFQALFMCLFCAIVLTQDSCIWWEKQLTILRLGLSVVMRSVRPCLFWNVIFCACKFGRVPIMSVVAPSYAVECFQLKGMSDDESYWAMSAYWEDVLELCVIVAVTWTVEKLAWEEAASTVSARLQRNEGKALRSILDATCDAVMQLNSELIVVGHSPKLAAMLLKSGASIEGTGIRSIFPEDGDSVVQKMQTNSEGSFALAFNAAMQDAAGNAVPIHGFHTQLTELDGSVSHLIGLSEAGGAMEARMPAPLPDLSALDGADQLIGQARRGRRRRRSASSRGLGTPSEPGSLHSGKLSNPSTPPDEARELLFPDRQPTKNLAQELSLIAAMESWNIPVSARDCCTFHAVLKSVQSMLVKMRRAECMEVNLDQASAQQQCRACGLLRCKPRRSGRCCRLCEEVSDAWRGERMAL